MSGASSPTIRLHLLTDAVNADGLPRAALLILPSPGTMDRRPFLQVFASVGATLAMKQAMEGSGHGEA